MVAVAQARGEAPRTGQQEAAVDGLREAGRGALAGDHRAAPFAEEVLDCRFAEVGARGADRQGRGHLHPARRRVAVGGEGEDLEGLARSELVAAELHGHPHLEQTGLEVGVDDLGCELAVLVGERRVGVEERHEGLGSFGQRRRGAQCRAHARVPTYLVGPSPRIQEQDGTHRTGSLPHPYPPRHRPTGGQVSGAVFSTRFAVSTEATSPPSLLQPDVPRATVVASWRPST